MAWISDLDTRFRWLLILAALQDAILCIGMGLGLGRLDLSAASPGGQTLAVILTLSGVGLVFLPFSLALTVWGFIMLRRRRAAGRPLPGAAQLAVLLAQVPIIVVVIYLILVAVTF